MKAAAKALERKSRPITKHSEIFEREYGKLNTEQRNAVDTVEGPVMVVAGPGTGKTQTVALRVANILRKTQAKPGNILCLTFSKSGASAMRDRLRGIIGADAYRITIDTIHGFCNDIIRQHPSVFQNWSSLHQITDVERYRELNKIIDQLLPDLAIVNPKLPYVRTREILGKISQLKTEGVTDEKTLRKVADAYEQQQSTKSGPATKAHAQNMLRARRFSEFVEIFLSYQKMLTTSGRYDYEDMILNVIAALQEEDWLLSGLQERYQYVLVDEFQDTNGAQYKLIELLTQDPTGDEQPNFFVVGDDDQAIYRFQGANLKNILSFRDRFPKAPVIALTKSYRCTQAILDAAEALISNNTERLVGHIPGLDKHLTSLTGVEGEPPSLVLAPSDAAEPWVIADLIDDRLKAGVPPEEMAVLAQTNAELFPLYEVFKARGIPVELTGKLDLLIHPVVEQAVAILRAIESPTYDDYLASALSASTFGLHPADLSKLYAASKDRKTNLMKLLVDVESLQEELKLLSPEKIIKARDTLLDLHNKKAHRSVLETLDHLYRECGLLTGVTKGKLDLIDFAAAQEFFERVRKRAAEHPDFSFEVFLDDLSYYRNPEYGELRMTYDLPHLTESGVQLMTAHKSKGLEFHTVILSNFREGHWDKRRHPPSLSVPEDLLFGWQKEQKDFEKGQDERRVAYVAITRAKREVLFVCPKQLTEGTASAGVSPSAFFAEAGKLTESEVDVRDPLSMSTLLALPVRKLDKEFEAYLRAKIESFSLSPTALHDFLEDPNLFVERHLLERPQPKEPFFAYGNAVHHALARFARNLKDGKPKSQEEFLADFKEHLLSREILTAAERTRLEHLGVSTLPKYFGARLRAPYPIVHSIEHALNARLGDVPIKGKIDRIDLLEEHSSAASVRDFKTGAPKTEKQCKDYGYVDQLTFYALLIEHGYPVIDPKEFVLDFVGERDEDPIERRFVIGPTDKKALAEVISAVWAKIVALDFTPL